MVDNTPNGTPPDFTQVREFWHLLGYAAVLGVFGAFAGLIFLGVTGVGQQWYGDPGTGWFEGELWWVVVAGVAGLVVGILRTVFRTPATTPGIIDDLQNEHVDARLVSPVRQPFSDLQPF